jgi:hypothetical protein
MKGSGEISRTGQRERRDGIQGERRGWDRVRDKIKGQMY